MNDIKNTWVEITMNEIRKNYYSIFGMNIKYNEEYDKLTVLSIFEKFKKNNLIGSYLIEESIKVIGFSNTNKRYDFLEIISFMLKEDDIHSKWIINALDTSYGIGTPVDLISLKESDNLEEDLMMWRLSE